MEAKDFTILMGRTGFLFLYPDLRVPSDRREFKASRVLQENKAHRGSRESRVNQASRVPQENKARRGSRESRVNKAFREFRGNQVLRVLPAPEPSYHSLPVNRLNWRRYREVSLQSVRRLLSEIRQTLFNPWVRLT